MEAGPDAGLGKGAEGARARSFVSVPGPATRASPPLPPPARPRPDPPAPPPRRTRPPHSRHSPAAAPAPPGTAAIMVKITKVRASGRRRRTGSGRIPP